MKKNKHLEKIEDSKNIFNLSFDIICKIGTDGNFKEVNPAFKAILEWEIDEVLDLPYTHFIHSEDIEYSISEISKHFTGNGPDIIINRHKTKSGVDKHISWKVNVNKETGDFYVIGRDISKNDHKLTEFELISKTVSKIKDAVVITNVKGEIIWVNDSFEKLTKYTKSETIGKKPGDFLQGKDTNLKTVNSIRNAIKNKTEIDIDIINYSKKGDEYWVNLNISPIYNNNGELENFIAIERDVTERKKLEIENQNIQKSLSLAQKLAKIGNWEFNLQTFELIWSDELYHVFEIDKNTPKENLYSLYRNKFNIEELASLDEKVKLCSEQGNSYEHYHDISLNDGTKKHILGKGFAKKNAKGKIVSLFGTAQDITEQREAENLIINIKNELQKFFDLSNDFMCIANLDGTFKKVNKTFEKTLGYTAEELINIPFTDFIHPDDLEITFKQIEKLAQGQLTINFENRYRCKDKSYIWLSWSVAPDLATGNLYATASDISEEKKIKEELIFSKEKAELASTTKSEFLANMSHEIRTPLNGIVGFSDLLKTTDLTVTQEMFTNTISQSAHSLLDVINDILDFSKIEAGKLELDIQKTNIYDILSQAIDVVTFQAQSKNIELLLNIDPQIFSNYYLDSIRTKQILVNLLGNAIKFTTEGDVELKVDKIKKSKQKETIRFSIIDSGVGIAKENQSKIFDAFSQADTSTTRKFGGTGLGLSISNKLLSLMNKSQLQLYSEIGVGSTFYFDLELDFEEELKVKKFKDNLSVLVVDNSIKEGEIIKKYLTFENIKTDLATSNKEALEFINQNFHYNAILIDSKVYNKDNNKDLKELKELISHSNINLELSHIALITKSIHNETYFKECEKLGINSKIIKPLKPFFLMETLDKLFNSTKKINQTKKEKGKGKEKFETPCSVLIVDDNEINILLAKTIIKANFPNASIIEAKDGLEALTKFKEHDLDLILMDVQMPNMNGYDATKEIRKLEENSRKPIVALTAGTLLGEKQKCINAGMDYYISKPILAEELIQIMKQIIK